MALARCQPAPLLLVFTRARSTLTGTVYMVALAVLAGCRFRGVCGYRRAAGSALAAAVVSNCQQTGCAFSRVAGQLCAACASQRCSKPARATAAPAYRNDTACTAGSGKTGGVSPALPAQSATGRSRCLPGPGAVRWVKSAGAGYNWQHASSEPGKHGAYPAECRCHR